MASRGGGGFGKSGISIRSAMVGSVRSVPTSPRSTCSENPTIRPPCGLLSRRKERPTLGNRTNRPAVNQKMGIERRQVATKKARSTTLRLRKMRGTSTGRSEEHTSELQSRGHLVCRLLLEKK